MKELDEIRARLEAATPGPWYCDGFADGDVVSLSIWECDQHGRVIADTITRHGDADLLMNAPTDLARLLAAVEAVEALCNSADAADGLYRKIIHTHSIRAAITAALTPTPAVPSVATEPRGAVVAVEDAGAEIGPEQALSGGDA